LSAVTKSTGKYKERFIVCRPRHRNVTEQVLNRGKELAKFEVFRGALLKLRVVWIVECSLSGRACAHSLPDSGHSKIQTTRSFSKTPLKTSNFAVSFPLFCICSVTISVSRTVEDKMLFVFSSRFSDSRQIKTHATSFCSVLLLLCGGHSAVQQVAGCYSNSCYLSVADLLACSLHTVRQTVASSSCRLLFRFLSIERPQRRSLCLFPPATALATVN
jgi:hypothetical protein